MSVSEGRNTIAFESCNIVILGEESNFLCALLKNVLFIMDVKGERIFRCIVKRQIRQTAYHIINFTSRVESGDAVEIAKIV